ncbi:MAG: hypothetical protein HY456_03245 [Parcubacteria group bacterium]|nr:hypothetical protein [Parcubacteria group bacterium]
MRRVLQVLLFIVGITLSLYSFGQWRIEESYNKALAEERMPDEEMMKALPKASLSLKAYLDEASGDFDAVVDSYQSLLQISNGSDKRALFNLANVYVQNAFIVRDPRLIAAAIEYYKAALRIAPDFLEAKYNLDVTMRLLKMAKSQSGQSGSQSGQPGDKSQDKIGPAQHIPFKASDI